VGLGLAGPGRAGVLALGRPAALGPPSPGEAALFETLSRSQPDADRFIAMLAGVVPVREFMSPRTVVGLVGLRGFARLVAGQARRDRPPAAGNPVAPSWGAMPGFQPGRGLLPPG
jgi:hypothetical protein